MNSFKYIKFEKMSVGVRLAGYTAVYTP
jgi:hypothetical protein